jgi:hypothetical protein
MIYGTLLKFYFSVQKSNLPGTWACPFVSILAAFVLQQCLLNSATDYGLWSQIYLPSSLDRKSVLTTVSDKQIVRRKGGKEDRKGHLQYKLVVGTQLH